MNNNRVMDERQSPVIVVHITGLSCKTLDLMQFLKVITHLFLVDCIYNVRDQWNNVHNSNGSVSICQCKDLHV